MFKNFFLSIKMRNLAAKRQKYDSNIFEETIQTDGTALWRRGKGQQKVS